MKRRQKSVKRDKCVQNFETAKSAVILFDTMLPGCFQHVKDLSKFLTSKNIKTKAYGLVAQKETPQEMLLWANIEFITKKDRLWYGAPSGDATNDYFNQVPDLLFVINFKESLTLDYLVSLSRARFKVGCFTDQENDLDLMINPAKKECEAGFFIEQVKHYISLLNPSN